MDRNCHLRHVPMCETRIHPVDQYSFDNVDTTERTCNNGVSHPIYSCNGEISRFLPLDMYPKVNELHPQIRMGSQPHFGIRDPNYAKKLELTQLDLATKRLEGFYIHGGEYDPTRLVERRMNRY
jgi:hypothetical protein